MRLLALFISILPTVLINTNAEPVHSLPGFRLPPGFVISPFADQGLADDICCMTLDSKGRIVVAGRGYLRTLVDDNGDGKADRAIPFSDTPKDGAQGLLWKGHTLYCVGDGGLRKFEDRNGDGVADGPSQLLRKFRTGGEHDGHALRRGPDGWLYLLCGNTTGIGKNYATVPASPVKEPVAGCVVRFAPDWSASEIVADGFRNAYAMDFNLDHELFTFDSDNERCLGLPWYEPTRFYQVIPGGHYGWRGPHKGEVWRYPPYFPDVIAPVATLGRGSPTAVECYRHTRFPTKYRGGMFLADWTFGRIYHMKLHRQGASYRSEPEVFLEATGENGFAPTAIVVHPQTGDMYISSGGRGTRGAVYRIRYVGEAASVEPSAHLPPVPLSWDATRKEDILREATSPDLLLRRRALDALWRHSAFFEREQVLALAKPNLACPDRHVKLAATRLLTSTMQGTADDVRQACILLADITQGQLTRLDAIRLVQRSLGEIGKPTARKAFLEGYSLRGKIRDQDVPIILAAVRQAFPSGNAELDCELSRTLAILGDDGRETLTKMLKLLTEKSDPRNDFHYLIVLSQLRAPREEPERETIAQALIVLEGKMRQRHLAYETHWPQRLREVAAELCERDPLLPAVLLKRPAFGKPEHVLLVQGPGWDRLQAAKRFWGIIRTDPQYPLTPELVDLMGDLPREEITPRLRHHWEEWGLRDAILLVLARRPQPEDRRRFLEGLASPSWATVTTAAKALRRLSSEATAADFLAVMRALQRIPEGKEGESIRGELFALLAAWNPESHSGTDAGAWQTWFRKHYPQEALTLDQLDGVDIAVWKRRLEQVAWEQGQPERGAVLYQKTGCVACHTGGRALGPDLSGVTRRFSRDDLFTAIVQPSRDLPARYQASIVLTQEGKVHHGSIIYQAVDGLLLQTDAATTLRIAGNQIAAVRLSDRSLMPSGLLDHCSDQDLADLYAYMKTLQATPAVKK
jgi:putative heme-binding domain-containing protein